MRKFTVKIEPFEMSMLGEPSVMAAVAELHRRLKNGGTGVLQYSVKVVCNSELDLTDNTIRVTWNDGDEHRMISLQFF